VVLKNECNLPFSAGWGIWEAKAAIGLMKDPWVAAIKAACCWKKKRRSL